MMAEDAIYDCAVPMCLLLLRHGGLLQCMSMWHLRVLLAMYQHHRHYLSCIGFECPVGNHRKDIDTRQIHVQTWSTCG